MVASAGSSIPYRVGIVGGGPRATYALERLTQLGPYMESDVPLEVHVFERTGEFGAGAIHSARQPFTNVLNRIASQVSFAADETTAPAGRLRPPDDRPTLHDWCRDQFARTGDAQYDLLPTDWPRRSVHGAALADRFQRYAAELAASGARVELHHAEVVDIERQVDGRLLLICLDEHSVPVDHVLLVTGHSHNDPERSDPHRASLHRFARRTGSSYLAATYPVDEILTYENAGPTSRVACAAMGVAAIDQILFLTEGRGGRFERSGNGRLAYRRSGQEPLELHAFSRSGLFPFARPLNARSVLPESYAIRPTFLTIEAINRLGRWASRQPGAAGQLCFESQVLPLVVLEMAVVHYQALIGSAPASWLAEKARPSVDAFLARPSLEAVDASMLVEPLERGADLALATVDAVVTGRWSLAEAEAAWPWSVADAVERWVTVVHGADAAVEAMGALRRGGAATALADHRSPHGLEPVPTGNRFRWDRFTAPITTTTYEGVDGYQRAWLKFMHQDIAWAEQGNVDNPHKAASDGVWRDLRGVISHAVDVVGLTAASHENLVSRYYPLHNRLVNGTGLEVMKKIVALVEAGVLDISLGPGATVVGDGATGRFAAFGPATGARAQLDTVADARVHRFDARADARPLFPRLLRRNLVSLWQLRTPGQPPYVPGLLDLDQDFHPVDRDGRADPRITVLGPAASGRRFFQLAALRPGVGHAVMNDLARWASEVSTTYAERVAAYRGGSAPVATPAVGAQR